MIAVSWFHFVDTVRRHGGGYVDYRWPKPGSNQPQQKFSYVAGFEPWQWVVGTGVYVDDMEKQIADAARHTLIIAGLLMVMTAAIAVFVVRGMSHAIRTMTGAMNDLAAGRTDIVLPAVKGSDEIGEPAKALTVFRQNLLRVATLRNENTEKDRQAAEQRQATLARLAHDPEGSVRKVADDLGSTALQIGANAGVMEHTKPPSRPTGSAPPARTRPTTCRPLPPQPPSLPRRFPRSAIK
jgi:methyl-accepting chemotaxis protein